MYECIARTSIHSIPTIRLLIYYLILISIYIVFLRIKRHDLITAVIIMMFTRGFFLYFGKTGYNIHRYIMILILFSLLFSGKKFNLRRNDLTIIFCFIIFTASFYLSWINNYKMSITFFSQYHTYFEPIVLYFGIKKQSYFQKNLDYYIKLIIRLVKFQIIFSIIKLIVIGFRENIIGSIGSSGGDISVTYAVIPLVLYWFYKDGKILRKDLIFLFSLLIIPISSNKRAIWILFPTALFLLNFNYFSKRTIKKIGYITIILPLIIYFGFRLNPSFNPERKFWGSFDLNHALNWSIDYQTGRHKSDDLGRGRIGKLQIVLNNTLNDMINKKSIFGYGTNIRQHKKYDYEDFGITGGGESGLARSFLEIGYFGTFFLLCIYILLLRNIRNKFRRNIVLILLLLQFITYTGAWMLVPIHSTLFIFLILYLEEKDKKFYYQNTNLSNYFYIPKKVYETTFHDKSLSVYNKN